jgi:cell wall-associated NlpC family hydrolase
MTPTWFNSEERCAKLFVAARSWRGTPWRENSAFPGPGGGVSCHNLAAEIYFDTGCLDRFGVPRGSVRTLRSSPAKAMLDYLDAQLGERFAKIEPGAEDLQPGDLIVMREGEHVRHVGIVVPSDFGPQFVHVLPRLGVTFSETRDATYSNRVEAIRRPLP